VNRSHAETGDRKPETGDWKPETGDWRLETGNWKLETGNWKLETGNRKPETACWKGGQQVPCISLFARNGTPSSALRNYGLASKASALPHRDNAPSRRDNAPSRRANAPSRRDNAPSRRDNAPSWRDNAPSRRDNAPSRRDNAPSWRDNAPSWRDNAPSRRDNAPSWRDNAPSGLLLGCNDLYQKQLAFGLLNVARASRSLRLGERAIHFLEIVCIEVIVFLTLDCEPKERGHGRPGRVETGLPTRSLPIGIKEQPKAHGRCLRLVEPQSS